MLTNKRTLIATYLAISAIPAYSLATFGANDGEAKPAAAGNAVLGVSTEIDVKAGERVDITLNGVAPVRYGTNVTAGQPLKADATGAAVPAGAGEASFGMALLNGVAGDIGSVLLGR